MGNAHVWTMGGAHLVHLEHPSAMKKLFAFLLSTSALLAQYAAVPGTAYPALEAILNAKPAFTKGSGAPSSNCTQGLDLYLNTANAAYYVCSATNTWLQVGNGGGVRNVSINCPTVTGNGSTDDTTAFQACLDNTPDYWQLLIPAGYAIKITATLNLHTRYGFRLTGMSSSYGGPGISTAAPSFYWAGSTNGTMLSIDDVENAIFENLTFFTSTSFGTGTTGAGTAILVDQTLSSGPIVTNLLFDHVSIYGTQRNTNFIGIDFAPVGTNNVDAITIQNSTIKCANTASVGIGIKNAHSANAIGHLYQNNIIWNCLTGISVDHGVADVIHNQLNTSVTHLSMTPSAAVHVSDNDSENSTYFLVGGSPGMVIEGNRIASTTPPSTEGAIKLTNGGFIRVSGNHFDAGSYAAVSCPGNQGNITSIGNNYPNNTQTKAGFVTCIGGVVSMSDFFQTANVTTLLSLLPVDDVSWGGGPAPEAGMMHMAYALSNNKFQVSENGVAYRLVLPVVSASDPGCTTTNHIGRLWFNTTTTTTATKACKNVSGTLTWVTF